MAVSKYCQLCHGHCDNCPACRLNPDRFKPTADMIKKALEKTCAFTSSAFCTISSELPKFSVTKDGNGKANVAVRLKSMRFIPEYSDPESEERKKLEKAVREEIIRSFHLPRVKVKDCYINVDIREESEEILICMASMICAIAKDIIIALNSNKWANTGIMMAFWVVTVAVFLGTWVVCPEMAKGGVIGVLWGFVIGNIATEMHFL